MTDITKNMQHTSLASPIMPGATLGVMGGGQLGRMFVHAAQQMGYFTAVLDEAADSPAGCISHHHIRTSYTDEQGLHQMKQTCAAITTEFENVPAQALHQLAHHLPVFPKAHAVEIAQDRALEKKLFLQSGVDCAPHALIASIEDLANIDATLFPGILKTTRLGYDGKGQINLTTIDQLPKAWANLGKVPCILEKKMPLASEISVLVARGQNGQCINFPVQHNIHRNGILAVTQVPLDLTALHANATQQQCEQAIQAAKQLAQTLDYVGVLCVEFFILENGRLIANEIAPRPHNSAHWSMNGCSYSQFEAQVRTLTGLPLYQPHQYVNAIMLNLLGDLWFDANDQERSPSWDKILTLPGTHLHLYGKTQAKKGRKMGHLNITGSDFSHTKKIALQAAAILGIAPW